MISAAIAASTVRMQSAGVQANYLYALVQARLCVTEGAGCGVNATKPASVALDNMMPTALPQRLAPGLHCKSAAVLPRSACVARARPQGGAKIADLPGPMTSGEAIMREHTLNFMNIGVRVVATRLNQPIWQERIFYHRTSRSGALALHGQFY